MRKKVELEAMRKTMQKSSKRCGRKWKLRRTTSANPRPESDFSHCQDYASFRQMVEQTMLMGGRVALWGVLLLVGIHKWFGAVPAVQRKGNFFSALSLVPAARSWVRAGCAAKTI